MKLLPAVFFVSSTLVIAVVFAVGSNLSITACAKAGGCGECWNTGIPGTLNSANNCIKCKKVATETKGKDAIEE